MSETVRVRLSQRRRVRVGDSQSQIQSESETVRVRYSHSRRVRLGDSQSQSRKQPESEPIRVRVSQERASQTGAIRVGLSETWLETGEGRLSQSERVRQKQSAFVSQTHSYKQ